MWIHCLPYSLYWSTILPLFHALPGPRWSPVYFQDHDFFCSLYTRATAFKFDSPCPVLFWNRFEHPAAGAESSVSECSGGARSHCELQLLKHFPTILLVQTGAWGRSCLLMTLVKSGEVKEQNRMTAKFGEARKDSSLSIIRAQPGDAGIYFCAGTHCSYDLCYLPQNPAAADAYHTASTSFLFLFTQQWAWKVLAPQLLLAS